jgi:hypothetical protein
MACTDYAWTDTTHKDILGIIKWFQNKFNLKDWEITIETGPNVPVQFKKDEEEEIALGWCVVKLRKLKAYIWVPLSRIERNNQNATAIIIHEMIHVLLAARNIKIEEDDENNPEECLTHSLEGPLYELYCREHRKKPTKLCPDPWIKIIP